MPNTLSPRITPTPPICEPYLAYIKDAITSEMKASLLTYLHHKSGEFTRIGESRDVIYYGEYDYKYSGGSHKAREIPPQIKNLLDHIKTSDQLPSANFNSCLVTRYQTGKDSIPAHRDNELTIDPESFIVTISMGSERVVKFFDNDKSASKELMLHDCSMLISNRQAQNFWTHEINEDDTESVRYSFTFRNVSPHFLNSTIILGDSNTRLTKFGSSKGTFGKWMPGKRIQVSNIEDLPDASKIGCYRNIVIHTGINNLNNANYRRSSRSLIDILEQKCTDYMNVYLQSKLFISLLLPTKLNSLNHLVQEFNDLLLSFTCKYRNISIIDHSVFGNKLSDINGRYDTREGCANKHDFLHLGKSGLRLFAIDIKTAIFGKRSSNSRRRHNAGNGQFNAAVARGTPSNSSPSAGRVSNTRVSPSNRQSPGSRGSFVAGTRVSPIHGENRFSILEDHHD